MAEDDKYKKCPEYCPFLKANNTFCELFKKPLQLQGDARLKCEGCKNPEQRMAMYQSLGLTLGSRIDMWQKAVVKHNEIELGKKREEEEIRQKFAAKLAAKYGDIPPLAGNMYLNNLIINLYMVLDKTERSMMDTLLAAKNGNDLIAAIERAPKDESLLRNIRRELDAQYREHQQTVQKGIVERTQQRV